MELTASRTLALIQDIEKEGKQLFNILNSDNCTTEEVKGIVYDILTLDSEENDRFSEKLVEKYLEHIDLLPNKYSSPIYLDYLRALRSENLVYFLKM